MEKHTQMRVLRIGFIMSMVLGCALFGSCGTKDRGDNGDGDGDSQFAGQLNGEGCWPLTAYKGPTHSICAGKADGLTAVDF